MERCSVNQPYLANLASSSLRVVKIPLCLIRANDRVDSGRLEVTSARRNVSKVHSPIWAKTEFTCSRYSRCNKCGGCGRVTGMTGVTDRTCACGQIIRK